MFRSIIVISGKRHVCPLRRSHQDSFQISGISGVHVSDVSRCFGVPRLERRTKYDKSTDRIVFSLASAALVSAIARLSDWASHLIDIGYIMSKQFTELNDTLLKIRMMKCGIRLCGHLSVLTEETSETWIVSARLGMTDSRLRGYAIFLSEKRFPIKAVGVAQ